MMLNDLHLNDHTAEEAWRMIEAADKQRDMDDVKQVRGIL
jgi:hypothetical protein